MAALSPLKNFRFVLLLLLAVMVAAAVYFFREVILPFALAGLLAFLLAPAVTWVSQRKIRQLRIPRGLSILAIYAFGLGFFSLMGLTMGPKLTTEFNGLVRELPSILKNMERQWIVPAEKKIGLWLEEFIPNQVTLDSIQNGQAEAQAPKTAAPPGGETVAPNGQENPLGKLVDEYTYLVTRLDKNRYEIVPKKRNEQSSSEQAASLELSKQFSATFRQLRFQFEHNMIELIQLTRKYLGAIINSLLTTFLVLMTTAFILLDPQRVHQFICSLLPESRRPAYEELMQNLDRGLSGVVRGQVTICLINGISTGVGLAVIGVPFVITLSLIATLFSLIPIFGVLISTIPIILMALTVSLATAVYALAWVILVHFVEGNFLNPKIMGDSAKIHPVLIIFALMVGQHLGGIMGTLLAVPVFSLIQNSFLFLKGVADKMESTS